MTADDACHFISFMSIAHPHTTKGRPMQRSRLYLLFLLLGISLSFWIHTSFAQSKAQKIDDLITLYNDYRQFNGSVLVAENGKVILKKGYGLANIEWNIPNQPDTRFRLGSITKQFTSMLIMQLVQQGKIRLDGKISDYLPYYPKKTGDRITIHHLLTHTSGIPNYTSFPSFRAELERKPYTPEVFTRVFADSALEFEPGTKWAYSNSGYFVLGAVIEKVTGKPYEQVLRENILAPLGMSGTGYDHSETVLPKRAAGYEKRGREYVNAGFLDMSLPFAAGSLYSTVEDLFVWDQALYTNRLLSSENTSKMFTPFLNNYAYGWGVAPFPIGNTKETVATIQHGGGINGFNTLICRVPGDKHLIVLLNNTGGAPLSPIARSILGILYDKPFSPPKKSVANELLATIQDKGIPAGLAFYREMLSQHKEEYSLVESEMNVCGYEFINLKKYDEAIAILELNTEAFPQSSNTYDSLGEAYMLSGNREQAINNYQKSLELDPKNANAVDQLKILKGKQP
jgi:CubicO group peptidase (beta-lactamase class C family)